MIVCEALHFVSTVQKKMELKDELLPFTIRCTFY